MKNTRELVAVLDEDLASVLDGLGLLSALTEGRLRCTSCSSVLTLRSLAAFVPQEDGTYHLFCDEPGCADSFQARTPPAVSNG